MLLSIVHLYMYKNENVSGISKHTGFILRLRLLNKPVKCRELLRKQISIVQFEGGS